MIDSLFSVSRNVCSPNYKVGVRERQTRLPLYHVTSSTSSWSLLQKVGLNRNDTIIQKNVQLLAHTDDIDIIGRTKRDVTAFSSIERESTIYSQITADNYTFDTVKEFIYLGSKNVVSLEIKRRITLTNKSYYDLNGQLRYLS